MEISSTSAQIFWGLIYGLALAGTVLLLLLWAFQKKRSMPLNFETLANQLKINAYSGARPYAAGVYDGRGIILQPGRGSKQPPVAVFCDNPRNRQFVLKPRPLAQKWVLKRWTRPGLTGDIAFESLFSFEPKKEAERLLSPEVRKAAQKAAYGVLNGRLELQGRTIAYIEGEAETLKTHDQYLTALHLCLALAQSLEEGHSLKRTHTQEPALN
jgi:hypothetical protein